jgi:hypothetical protein
MDETNLMTPKHAFILCGILALAIIGGLYVHARVSSAVDMAKFEQVQKDVATANQKAIELQKQATQDRLDAAKQQAAQQQQLLSTLAAISAQKQQPVNTDELVNRILARMPQAGITADALNKLPDAPTAQKSISDYLYDCDSCKVERDSLKQQIVLLQKQLADLDTENKALATQLANTAKERDAAVKAAKSSKWRKFGSALKQIGIGVGVGFTVAKVF